MENPFKELKNADFYRKETEDKRKLAINNFKKRIVSEIVSAAEDGKESVSLMTPLLVSDSDLDKIIGELECLGFIANFYPNGMYDFVIRW